MCSGRSPCARSGFCRRTSFVWLRFAHLPGVNQDDRTVGWVSVLLRTRSTRAFGNWNSAFGGGGVPPVGRVLVKRVRGVDCLRLGLKLGARLRVVRAVDRYLASSASRHRGPSSLCRSRCAEPIAVSHRLQADGLVPETSNLPATGLPVAPS